MSRRLSIRMLLSLIACFAITLTAGFAQEAVSRSARATPRPNPYAVRQLPFGQRPFNTRLTTPANPLPPILGVPGIFSSGGSFAQSVAVGDLNGDGKLDIVIANGCPTTSTSNCSGASGGVVGVLLGNGDGTYKPAVTYATGGFDAAAVAVADVNGDGKLDLIVVNSCSTNTCSNEASTVSVLFGNGNGTFKTAVTYASGGDFAVGLAVADVNGDHRPDLLVVNDSGTVGVLLNKGNGTFATSVTYLAGGNGNAVALAVGDVNGDGKPDLAVANYNTDTVSILLGKGDGTFQTAVPYATGGGNPQAVALGDVNGDGKLDLVVANCSNGDGGCGIGTQGSINVILGNGDGTFQNYKVYDSGGELASSVALADVNKDGKLDIVVADGCATNSYCDEAGGAAVLLSNGDGTFQTAVTYAAGGGNQADNQGGATGYTVALVTGDVNGDGKPDLIVVDGGTASAAAVVLGNGNGTFQSWAMHNSGGYGGSGPTVADLNGDGKLDIVTGDGCNPPGDFGVCDSISNGPGAVGVLLGDGKGGFQSAVSYQSGGDFAGQPVVADVNGDGILDVVIPNACVDINCAVDGTVGVLLGNGDGTLKPAVAYDAGGFYPFSVAVADMNGDGKRDVVVVSYNLLTNQTGSVAVLFNNGDGTFRAPVVYGPIGFGIPSGLAVRDLNGDGIPDVVVGNTCLESNCQSGGGVFVLIGEGHGKFHPVVAYSSGGQNASVLTLGDVNRDGRIDILVANRTPSNTVGVLLGNGDGTFQPAVPTSVLPSVGQLALTDFNRDGKLDLVVSTGSLLLGNGDGTFQLPINLEDAGGGIAVGDFNHDGRPDLVIGNYDSVDVLLNITPKK